MRLSLVPPHHTFQPSSDASDHQRGGSESSRSVAETDDYFFELRGEAQLRLGAERGRFFRRAGRRQVARQLGAQLAASA